MNTRICGSYIPADGINEESLSAIDFRKITHVYLAFSTLRQNENGIFVPTASSAMINSATLVKQKIAASGAESLVLFSIGGAGADGFCEAAASPEGRSAFAKACKEFIESYGIDGVDIDWEFPGLAHGGIKACKQLCK